MLPCRLHDAEPSSIDPRPIAVLSSSSSWIVVSSSVDCHVLLFVSVVMCVGIAVCSASNVVLLFAVVLLCIVMQLLLPCCNCRCIFVDCCVDMLRVELLCRTLHHLSFCAVSVLCVIAMMSLPFVVVRGSLIFDEEESVRRLELIFCLGVVIVVVIGVVGAIVAVDIVGGGIRWP